MIKYRIYLISFIFVVLMVLEHYYGPLLFSKVFGLRQEYEIGKLCYISRAECENAYFKDYLNKIESLSKEDRFYFSEIIIRNDRVGYIGNCPCPYNEDSRNYSCGGRSSYSKGGQISYCYDNDVSATQISTLRTSMITGARKNLNSAVQKDINIYREYYTLLILIILYCILLLYFKHKRSKI